VRGDPCGGIGIGTADGIGISIVFGTADGISYGIADGIAIGTGFGIGIGTVFGIAIGTVYKWALEALSARVRLAAAGGLSSTTAGAQWLARIMCPRRPR
jgi:hypothetical protein